MKRAVVWFAVMLCVLSGAAYADSHTAYSNLLTIDNRANDMPAACNTRSPQGIHFIPGMPGTLTFQTDITWNGSPGTVYFTINGAKSQATVTDLGGGNASAALTISAPSVVGTCSEVTVEVTNAEGKKTIVNGGLHFHPMPGSIIPWYRDNIPWNLSGFALTFGDSRSVFVGPLNLGDILKLKVEGGLDRKLTFDMLAGTFKGSHGGFSRLSLEVANLLPIDVYAEGSARRAGDIAVSYAGCGSPTVTRSWEESWQAKVGMGAPVVVIVEPIFPPAAPPINFLLNTPVVCRVVGALKLKAFFLFGGGMSGVYDPALDGPCYLGSKSVSQSWTAGLEGQAVLEWKDIAEVGVYVGGNGTPKWRTCPDQEFESVTLRGYWGVFASAFLFKYKAEVGCELSFDSGGEMKTNASQMDVSKQPTGNWQPIGDCNLQYGEMNRVAAAGARRTTNSASAAQSGGSTEEVIIENVTKLSGPCVMADSQGSRMLFPLHDPNKPWYAATDIADLHGPGGTNWTMDRVTDDQAAEFSPQAAVPNAGFTLAAWTRVSGDVSQAAGPEQIAPHLDIVVAKLDTQSGQWSAPEQLTSNSLVDRDPVPVVFGSAEGVLWIQNEADAVPGNATNGDRLMYSGWSGSAWSSPQTLWSGQKGLISVAYVADGSGQGHAVFAVDEDGDLETRTDRELYQVATSGSVWGSAIRVTNDAVEDSLPTLVAPNGTPICVWNAGGTLSHSRLDSWNPEAVYSEYTISNEAASLDGVTMPGGAAIAYAVQLSTGVDIVASFYDASLDSWSLPRQLTNDADVETALSLGCDSTQLVIGYLKNRTVRAPVDVVIDGKIQHLQDIPQPSQTDLCVLRHTLGSDLAAGAITVNPVNPIPGTAATITATVENRGDVPESNIDVAFFDGDPINGGIQIGSTQNITGPLVAGTSADVSVSWNVPVDSNPHRLYVVVDQDLSVDDRDRANNTASTLCVLPDLIVETGWSTGVTANAVAITAKIVNQGVLAAGAFEVGWHVGSPDGPEIGRSPVESLAAGANTEVTYVWLLSQPATVEFIQICAVADCANTVTEADESNNDGYQSVKAPSYDAPTSLTIGAAKNAQDQAPVALDAKIVTAVLPGCLYIEEPDRFSGVKVVTSASYTVGDAVTVTGRVDASGDEVAINADSVTPATASGTIKPLGLVNRLLGGGAHGRQAAIKGGTGLNNIGLLVRIWGKVTQVGSDYLYVDDGSAIKDGTLTGSTENVGVRVVCDPTGYVEGEYLMLTGISSCFKNASDQMQRRVLVRQASDIQSNSTLPLSIPRVSDAKSVPQGSTVSMTGKKVASAFGGFFYVEELDRSSGMKIVSDTVVNPGDLTWITGQIGTFNGERLITATMVTSQPDLLLLGPLGMCNPALGGSMFGLQPGVAGGFGLTNVGLLIRAWGRVTQVGSGYLYIDDGAGLKDGSSTSGVLNQGVRVICDPAGFASNDYVVVTGASSCYPAGFGYGRQIYAIEVRCVAQ